MKRKFIVICLIIVLLLPIGVIYRHPIRQTYNTYLNTLWNKKNQTITFIQQQPGSNKERQLAFQAMEELDGMVLPKKLYLVEGKPFSIFLKAIVGVYDPEVYTYSIESTGNFAVLKRRLILLSPPEGTIGNYQLTVTANTLDGNIVDSKTIELIVIPKKAGRGQEFQMLMIGDSLGHQSRFPNELATLLSSPENPKVQFVGTHKPPGAIIPHEQYGGWRFIYFYTVIDQDPESFHRDRSPFVFKSENHEPEFNVRRYLDEELDGANPDYVHIQLGTNDAFLLDANDILLDDQLNEIITHAETLISGIRKALPLAYISVGTVIQGNASNRAFVESYTKYPQFQNEWRWRQLQMKLAKKMMEHFQDRENERVLMVPTHLAVDPLDGFSPHNFVQECTDYSLSCAVHPSKEGDEQLALTIYQVLKGHLYEKEKPVQR